MNPIIFVSLTAVCLAASILAAPTTTEMTAGQPSSTDPAQQMTSSQSTPVEQTTPDSTQTTSTMSSSMAVSSSHDSHDLGQLLNTTSFTCAGREIGYYADTERECKVYHFCLLGDYNGEAVYQRISYLCLNETVFDQQALDCVETGKSQSPCKDAPNHYTVSNKVLRTAILGKVHQESLDSTKPTSTTPSASTTSS